MALPLPTNLDPLRIPNEGRGRRSGMTGMKDDDGTSLHVSAVVAESFTATENQQQHRSTEDIVAAEFAHVPLWKRVLDISCSLIAIPCLLPLMLLIGIVIKISSKGPVFFRQERVGLCGKPFMIFKFRTMTAGTDTGVH